MRAAAIAAVIGLAAAGCGGPRAPAHVTADPSARAEITALWTQIRAWRHEGGMEVEPDDDAVSAMQRMSVASAARTCVLPGKPAPACTDICEIGSAICDNAEDICAIAATLGDDAWAKDKCASAKASCREAQERCCTCNRGEALP